MSKSKLAFFPPFSEKHKWGEEDDEEDGERLIVIFAFPSVWESVVSGKKGEEKEGFKAGFQDGHQDLHQRQQRQQGGERRLFLKISCCGNSCFFFAELFYRTELNSSREVSVFDKCLSNCGRVRKCVEGPSKSEQ